MSLEIQPHSLNHIEFRFHKWGMEDYVTTKTVEVSAFKPDAFSVGRAYLIENKIDQTRRHMVFGGFKDECHDCANFVGVDEAGYHISRPIEISEITDGKIEISPLIEPLRK